MNEVLKKLLEINEWVSGLPYVSEHVVPYTGNYTGAVVAGGAILLLLLSVMLLKLRRKKEIKAPPPAEVAAVEELEEIEPEEQEEKIDEKQIVNYFHRLYKVQLGEPQQTRGKVEILEHKSALSNKTYELSVFHNKEWVKRRMTIGLLGEHSASRSQCFYVIFDNHLVVKIPQKPIRDFETYISVIESEHRIVEKLSPRECIVPSVSAVLKLIRRHSEEQNLAPVQLEEKFLRWLREYPNFQEYLKIGDSFVFVMDLSRYFFLSRIITDFHNLDQKLFEEIVGYPDVIWANHGFEGRYAFENDEQVEALRKIFSVFEDKTTTLIKNATGGKIPPRYTMQKWFLTRLSGKELKPGEKYLTPEITAQANQLIGQLFQDQADIVEAYRNTIKGCIQDVTVSQNKFRLAGLVNNMLDLLTWLSERGVAMRDLKPDNLLVAGDQNRYPDFLDVADGYSVGLIDVEIAAVFDRETEGVLSQPPLGGTPSYATPSHLIPNQVIATHLKNSARMLYLQDWYATIAIIYELLTGERLFAQTGKMFLGIKTAMLKHMDDADVQFDLFVKASRMFWHNANSEFTGKTRDKEEILKMVKVIFPERTRDMFRREMSKAKQALNVSVKEIVSTQTVFKNPKTRKGLIAAPRRKITEIKLQWKKKQKDHPQAIKVLEKLEFLKIEIEKQHQLERLFSQKEVSIPVYELLYLMFGIVQSAMYRPEWGDLLAAEVVGVKDGKETTTVEATV